MCTSGVASSERCASIAVAVFQLSASVFLLICALFTSTITTYLPVVIIAGINACMVVVLLGGIIASEKILAKVWLVWHALLTLVLVGYFLATLALPILVVLGVKITIWKFFDTDLNNSFLFLLAVLFFINVICLFVIYNFYESLLFQDELKNSYYDKNTIQFRKESDGNIYSEDKVEVTSIV